MEYNKPPKTFEEQISILKSRGLIIEDVNDAINILNKINYYRLRGYWLSFEKQKDKFLEGIIFKQILKLYDYDWRLKNIIQNAIGFIEISLRTQAAYNFAITYGAFGHEEYNNFRTSYSKYEEWINDLHENTKKSREIYISHFNSKYSSIFPKIPIWVAVEILSFGSLTKFVEYLHHKDQKKISLYFNLPVPVFLSWIKTFNYIRNLCAHHCRVWDRNLSVSMAVPKSSNWHNINPRKIGYAIFAINKVLNYCTSRDKFLEWRNNIETLIDNHPQVPDFWNKIGLSENWKENPLWKEDN